MIGKLYSLADVVIIVTIRICEMDTLTKDFSDEWWSVLYAQKALNFKLKILSR